MLQSILLIGLGGGVGSICRYVLAVWLTRFPSGFFPLGTFAVNFIGCLIIGILLGLIDKNEWTNPAIKHLFIVGFCGGFTTFSTFTAENYLLLQQGQAGMALIYTLASVLVCLFAFWIGWRIILA